MTAVDNLWFVADEADQQAAQIYHRLSENHEGYLSYERTRRVSRPRFRTLAERIRANGLPYGAHTLVYRPSGELLLVRHEGVDMWVLPGGEVDDGETFREGARRELHEEAGVEVTYDGMGILAQVRFQCDDHDTWGVLPVFEGQAETIEPTVSDPDGEISEARWFDDLPEDTRDRSELREWRTRRFDGG
jgi:8-oxo-dGTP diphosphatase